MHRFFLPPGSITGADVRFPPAVARQIHAVLRIPLGGHVIALDGAGQEYEVELLDERAELGRVLAVCPVLSEPRARVSLYLGLTQREKFEWALQKCTEVGVAAVIPVISSRCLAQKPAEVEQKRARWETILREAAEQCGRGIIPVLRPALKFAGALGAGTQDGAPALFLWEGEHQTGLRAVLAGRDVAQVSLLVGPEGGFSEEEAAQARAAGWLPVTLGRRILRMETAAVTSVALALDALGEMGSGSM